MAHDTIRLIAETVNKQPIIRSNKIYLARSIKRENNDEDCFLEFKNGRARTLKHQFTPYTNLLELIVLLFLILCLSLGSDGSSCLRLDRNSGRLRSSMEQSPTEAQ